MATDEQLDADFRRLVMEISDIARDKVLQLAKTNGWTESDRDFIQERVDMLLSVPESDSWGIF